MFLFRLIEIHYHQGLGIRIPWLTGFQRSAFFDIDAVDHGVLYKLGRDIVFNDVPVLGTEDSDISEKAERDIVFNDVSVIEENALEAE